MGFFKWKQEDHASKEIPSVGGGGGGGGGEGGFPSVKPQQFVENRGKSGFLLFTLCNMYVTPYLGK